MGCCVALAALVAVVRRAWFTMTGREPAEAALFAPPARRPAPGGLAVAVAAAPATTIAVRSPDPAAIRQAARMLVAIGLAWFAVGLVGMHLLGWFTWAEASMLSDTAFHSSGLWLAAAGATTLVVRA